MSIDKATRQWSSTDSAPDITVSKFEASEDESAEVLQSRGRPTTRNQSKLDKAKRSKSNPGTEEQDLSHTITNRQTSSNTSKSAGNNTKGHNPTHLKIHTSPASSPEGVSEDVESSSSVERKRKQPQSNQLKGRSIPTIQLFSDKILSESSVIHDEGNMMFKVDLDGNGSLGEWGYSCDLVCVCDHLLYLVSNTNRMTAGICYLPTRFRGIIEFYHTVSNKDCDHDIHDVKPCTFS
jgi:hypothetical protein